MKGVSKVVNIIPGDASNSKKHCHTKGVINLNILHTVHHYSDLRALHERTFLWLPAVLYCGQFRSVQLANEAKNQVPFHPLSLHSLSSCLLSFSPPFPALLKSKTSVPSYQKIDRLQQKQVDR